jgi:hypothetical protein
MGGRKTKIEAKTIKLIFFMVSSLDFLFRKSLLQLFYRPPIQCSVIAVVFLVEFYS